MTKTKSVVKKSKTNIVAQVTKEVCAAYNESTRNLSFKASTAVSVDDAVKIMTKALDVDDETHQGYNEFSPSLLRKLPMGSKVTLAREGSVCIYVKLPKGFYFKTSLFQEMKTDECDDNGNGFIRLWWD